MTRTSRCGKRSGTVRCQQLRRVDQTSLAQTMLEAVASLPLKQATSITIAGALAILFLTYGSRLALLIKLVIGYYTLSEILRPCFF